MTTTLRSRFPRVAPVELQVILEGIVARKKMAPFPTSVRSRSSGGAGSTSLSSGGLLPLHSPSASAASAMHAGTGMQHAYPPASSPRSTSPVDQQQGAGGMGAGETPQQRLQRLDPRRLFGAIKAPNHGGILKGGLGGITQESTETVRRCLEVSPTRPFSRLGAHQFS